MYSVYLCFFVTGDDLYYAEICCDGQCRDVLIGLLRNVALNLDYLHGISIVADLKTCVCGSVDERRKEHGYLICLKFKFSSN